jgi:hypothetical protein
VKYVEDLVLLDKVETMLQNMIDGLIEIERCYEMEMNMAKRQVDDNLKATVPNTDYGVSKTARECEIF